MCITVFLDQTDDVIPDNLYCQITAAWTNEFGQRQAADLVSRNIT
jgi:hypothetical protein